jgi:hypothetical protein
MFYKVITLFSTTLIYFIDWHLMNKLTFFTQVATLLMDEQESKLGDVDKSKKEHVLHQLNACAGIFVFFSHWHAPIQFV